jgi:outer membrane biosynthesis protein TonB
MALTMSRLKQFALSFALAVLVLSGAVSAQINPAVPKAAAQNAAQTANKSATQTPSTSATQTPEKKTSTSATQTPAPHDKKPADQQKTPPVQEKKPATAEKKPVVNDKKPPVTEKKPVSQEKKPAATDKKLAAPAASTKTAPAQKTPPAKDAKKSGDVVKTTKPVPPQGRRDPFIGLVGKQPGGAGGPSIKLPPGKGGLQVSTIMLQGIVSGPNGMIAVVANPQKSVYFLRVGDELFDGRVEKIEIGSVTFHEVGKDAFGKPVEREVTRKLNPSSGDQP